MSRDAAMRDAVAQGSTTMLEHQGDILVVDDQPANLAVLTKLLTDAGYKVRAVTSGHRALEAARLSPPDCVLLDVAMPGMDGFATCSEFRRDEGLAGVPIVFLTAFNDAEHKVQGFRVGGRDYVSKPFQAEEVLARVGNQLLVTRLERELRHQNQNLIDANAKLQEINELKARVTAMLVHDVRSPLSVIGSILHGAIDEEARRDAREAFTKMNTLLTDMLELHRSEQGAPLSPMSPIDLNAVLSRVIAAARHLANDKCVELVYEAPSEEVPVVGDASKLDRVFCNLVDNALKFTPTGGVVRVRIGRELGIGVEAGLRFVTAGVIDTGPGIAPEHLPYVFDHYYQSPSSHPRAGVGLGLSIVQRIVADHHGRVRVHSQIGIGSEFRVYLPE